ncbi:MAG: nucleotidyltransferase domain-containing protein [Actinobacteria bacterium]|nr:nucleotidyltransferase domain-containing protein [Actinomycetota bacterium]
MRDTDDVDTDRLDATWQAHDVTVAYLFGSRAEQTATIRSDHDIAVLFDHESTLRDVAALQADLTGVLGGPVDVVDLARASLELQATVVQHGRLLFSSDEPRRVTFESVTRSRWFDYRPVLQRLTRAYLHRVATRGL